MKSCALSFFRLFCVFFLNNPLLKSTGLYCTSSIIPHTGTANHGYMLTYVNLFKRVLVKLGEPLSRQIWKHDGQSPRDHCRELQVRHSFRLLIDRLRVWLLIGLIAHAFGVSACLCWCLRDVLTVCMQWPRSYQGKVKIGPFRPHFFVVPTIKVQAIESCAESKDW